MIYSPEKYKFTGENLNEKFYQLQGVLDDKEAKITLAQFLRHNVALTVYLLSGFKLYPYQELTIKAMLNRNFSMCVWARGGAKCLRYGSDEFVIEKNHGLISIIDLITNVDFTLGEKWIDINPISLWNGTEWVSVNKYLIQPNVNTINIKTSQGYSLCGSVNHLIQVWDKNNCTVIWKKYSDITKEDYICINRNHVNINNNFDNIENKEAYLIGLLIGDGSFSKSGKNINFCSADPELIDFITYYPSGKIINSKSKTKYINLETNFSIQLYNKYNLTKCDCYDKYIPKNILLNTNLLINCLRGLFDTDGTVSKNRLLVSFCTTSVVLAKQVHLSLLSLGIISKLKEVKTKSNFGKAYLVNIKGNNAKLFHNIIGFKLKRKSDILYNHLNKICNTNIDIIPGLKTYINKIKKEYRLPKIISEEWRNNIRRRSQDEITYYSLNNFINFFQKHNIFKNNEDINKIKNIYNNNYFFDKIDSIDYTQNNCIDFNVPNGERYWSNGFISHNSSIAAIFAFMEAVFNPNTSILIAGPTFRTSRFIFENLEKLVNSEEGKLLAQCFGHKLRRADVFTWQLNNGSVIKAIPLNGEKIRGFRANVLILDEYLLLPEELIKTVLMPFLIAPRDITERKKIRDIEDKLIASGKMQEKDRTKFKSNIKMVALSSASYTFENLYKTYQDWIHKICADVGTELNEELDEDKKEAFKDAKYFVSQLGYEALPEDMVDKNIINEAKSGTSDPVFDREYRALFTDGSASYFSAKKMNDITISSGKFPCIQVMGHKDKKYLLSIDPSWSSSPESDFFAMSLFELDTDNESGILVHSYAKAGKDLKEHIDYFHYLLTNFNIVMIIADNSDGNFLQAANESKLFKDTNLSVSLFDFDSSVEGEEYAQQLRIAKTSYNLESKCIAFKQAFSKDSFIRRANESLQASIDKKRIFFASLLNANDVGAGLVFSSGIDLTKVGEESYNDFIDTLDTNIIGTKAEAALIEVKTNPQGHQTFDLPANLKRQKGPNRTRRDRYTALLLGNWGIRCYFDLNSVKFEKNIDTFVPYMIK